MHQVEDENNEVNMSEKHEGWVLSILNFLNRENIPFYTRDGSGDRIPGKDRSIPERLLYTHGMIESLRSESSTARLRAHESQSKLTSIGVELRASNGLIDRLKVVPLEEALFTLLEIRREYNLMKESKESNDKE